MTALPPDHSTGRTITQEGVLDLQYLHPKRNEFPSVVEERIAFRKVTKPNEKGCKNHINASEPVFLRTEK